MNTWFRMALLGVLLVNIPQTQARRINQREDVRDGDTENTEESDDRTNEDTSADDEKVTPKRHKRGFFGSFQNMFGMAVNMVDGLAERASNRGEQADDAMGGMGHARKQIGDMIGGKGHVRKRMGDMMGSAMGGMGDARKRMGDVMASAMGVFKGGR